MYTVLRTIVAKQEENASFPGRNDDKMPKWCHHEMGVRTWLLVIGFGPHHP